MFLIRLQYLLPQRLLSAGAGWLADCRHPLVARSLIRLFIRKFEIDLSECVRKSPGDYDSFNDFFMRELLPGARPPAAGDDTILSPADGFMSCHGTIEHDSLLQAKGRSYRLQDLLVDPGLAARYVNGRYATVYLAPANYHRVHMPLGGKLQSLRYVPGRQFSVNPATTAGISDIYARNERLIAEFSGPQGRFCLVMVGALLVAGISTRISGRVPRTNQLAEISFLPDNAHFERGEEFGAFCMGSTVILLIEGQAAEWLSLQEKGPVRCNQALGRWTEKRKPSEGDRTESG